MPCFTEALYLLGKRSGWQGQEILWNFLFDELLELYFLNREQMNRAYTLMARYANVPMDFGDASLVVAAESLHQDLVFTLDKDFYIYRLHDNQAFKVIP